MKGLIWLRRLVVTLLAAMLFLVLFGVYIVVDRMVQIALLSQLGAFMPICLWLDRKLTWKLQRKLLLPSMITRLEASGEPVPEVRRAA